MASNLACETYLCGTITESDKQTSLEQLMCHSSVSDHDTVPLLGRALPRQLRQIHPENLCGTLNATEVGMRQVAFGGGKGQRHPLMATEAAPALFAIINLGSFLELGGQESGQLAEKLTRPGWTAAVWIEDAMGGPLCSKDTLQPFHPQVHIEGSGI